MSPGDPSSGAAAGPPQAPVYYRAVSSDRLCSSLAPPGRTWTDSCARRAPPSTPQGGGSLPEEMWQNGKIWQMAQELPVAEAPQAPAA